MHDFGNRIPAILPDLVAWRRDLHAHPELAFHEHRTSDFVAEKLREFGLEVHTGMAGTGVVGILHCGDGPRIGLRCDMDALPIQEATGVAYASQNAGVMHACGHDGHTTMLLGAARLLSEMRPASGALVFIFQPAEENEGGARLMIEDGLFDRFPVDMIFGMHNWPGLAEGVVAIHDGPVMAALDTFEAIVEGKGSHGAMPHQGVDPIMISGHLMAAWQAIVSRAVSPVDAAVISVTQIHAGDTWNVIPEQVVLRGTVRSFRPAVRDLLQEKMSRRADLVCQAFDASCRFTYTRGYPATVNAPKATQTAKSAALAAFGAEKLVLDAPPSMGAEDFAFMLEKAPGAYVWIGAGPDGDGRNLHSPRYDFNDAILPDGVRLWLALATTALSAET